jgi:hypothetical protein
MTLVRMCVRCMSLCNYVFFRMEYLFIYFHSHHTKLFHFHISGSGTLCFLLVSLDFYVHWVQMSWWTGNSKESNSVLNVRIFPGNVRLFGPKAIKFLLQNLSQIKHVILNLICSILVQKICIYIYIYSKPTNTI